MPFLTKLPAIARGIFKAVMPGAAALTEAIRNRKGVEMTVTTATGELVSGIAKPHDWWSVIPGMLAAVIMIYLVVTKQIPVADVIPIVKGLLGK